MPGTVLPLPNDSQKQQILAELRKRPRLVADTLPGIGVDGSSGSGETGRSTSYLGGDVRGPSVSVASEVALFDGTSGKLIKRATGTGIAKLGSGVLSIANAILAALEALSNSAGQLTNNGSGTLSWVNVVPSGVILMWSGNIATIPSGWVLCDGNNSTPDLRNRFIVGADADVSGVAKSTVTGGATQSGGSISYTPAGTVSVSIGDHPNTEVTSQASAGGSASGATLNTLTQRAHTHNLPTLAHVVSSQTFSGTAANIVPPYYALAFIMKT